MKICLGVTVMKYSIPSLQILIQNYFLQRLMQQRKASPETINSYRDTFRIYFEYLLHIHGVSAQNADIKHMGLEYLQEFCKYLEEKRGNKPVTINNRIAALRSFMKYVSEMEPEYSGTAKRALMIPMQKYTIPTMDFISRNEFEAMMRVCDTNRFIGARDKLMLLLLYNLGVRVSELLAIKCSDIRNSDIPNRTSIKIYGKGRKERIIPLWKNTSRYIQKYITNNHLCDDDSLFINKNGNKLTRSGVRSRVSAIVKEAEKETKTLAEKNITPHTFRHSVAINLLNAGVDISTIAIWLGHSSIDTTHKYMVADIEMKRKAMEKAGSSGDSSYRYKPTHDILKFLNTL